MRPLFVGITLIVLALLVAVGALSEMSGPGFGVKPPMEAEQDRISFQEEEATLTLKNAPTAKSLLGQDPAAVRKLLPKNLLPIWEEHKVDRRGLYHYRVRFHDTLSSIAARYLGQAALWKKILEYNPTLRDAEDLRADMELLIPLWLRVP